MFVIFTPNLGEIWLAHIFLVGCFNQPPTFAKIAKVPGSRGVPTAKPSPWAGIFVVWSLFAEVKSNNPPGESFQTSHGFYWVKTSSGKLQVEKNTFLPAPGATWLKIAWPQNSASGNNGNWWVRWWAYTIYTYPRNPLREVGIIGDLSDLFTSFSSLGVIPKITQANIQTSFRHVAVQEISELIFDKILQLAPLFPSLLHLQIFYCQHFWSKFPKSNSSFLGASCSPQCFLVRCQFEELRKELTGLARFELQPPGLRLRRNTKSIWGASCNKLQLIQRLGK